MVEEYQGNVGGTAYTCRVMYVKRKDIAKHGDYRLTPAGACPDCGTKIPGRWGAAFDGQITSTPFLLGNRRLRMV